MEVSAQSLARIATERQFQPATLERVIRLLDILDAIAADSLIAPRVALKGGTALNVFHAALDRLSVDIDLNYVGAVDKASMDEDRPGLEDRILRLRSEEHTSELQSLMRIAYAALCLKKQKHLHPLFTVPF